MVTDAFYPDSVGGAEHIIATTSKYLVKNGHEVYILVRKGKKGSLNEEVTDGIKIIRYPDSHRTFGLLYIPSLINVRNAFSKLISKKKFDIIHFHHPLTAFGAQMLAKIPKEMRTVYIFYGPAHLEFELEAKALRSSYPMLKKITFPLWVPIKSNLLRTFEHNAIQKAETIILHSEYSKKSLLDIHGKTLVKVDIVSGAIDTNKFSPAKDKLKIKEKLNIPIDSYVLLTVRRLAARMGLDYLIKAFSEITAKDNRFKLIIVGKGHMKVQLEKLAQELKLGNTIQFTGFMPEENLIQYYQAADLFILPTQDLEGFGISTIEALSCGVPVLGTSAGATEEILKKFDLEFLIPPASSKAISDWVLTKFQKKCLLQENISKKCREFVLANYTVEHLGKKTESIYYELLSK